MCFFGGGEGAAWGELVICCTATPSLCLAMLRFRAMRCICYTACGTGLQRLMESYTRLQQLRGLPATVPSNAAASLQQTSKVRDGTFPRCPSPHCICYTGVD